jgi:hypothetical protein
MSPDGQLVDCFLQPKVMFDLWAIAADIPLMNTLPVTNSRFITGQRLLFTSPLFSIIGMYGILCS